MLRAYSLFWNYSLGNQWLALIQAHKRNIPLGPIASFNRWKELGRHVKRGEKAIELCMPVTVKRTVTQQGTDGAETQTEIAFKRFVYKRHWFMLSQTDGAEFKAPAIPTWDRARALQTLNIEEIPFAMMNGNCQGYATGRQLAINPLAQLPAKTSLTLLMQATILYKQYAGPPRASPTTPIVRDAPKDSEIKLDGLPVRGNEGAKVVIVEFSDYQCPFCERHANGAGKQLEQKFVAAGRIRQAFVNNPLPIHDNAKLLATAAICAGKQEDYWQMHQALFEKKPRSEGDILEITRAAGLDVPRFQDCMKNPVEAIKRIADDQAIAKRFNLVATPAFAIGLVDEHGRMQVKKLVTGAQPLEVFDKVLEEMFHIGEL